MSSRRFFLKRLTHVAAVASIPLTAAISCLSRPTRIQSAEDASNLLTTTLYDANPQHVWNRLYAALLIRCGPDGRVYGEDRLEPLLWKESKYLLDGNSNEQAVDALDDFLRAHGESTIRERLKRAVMQRDLWLVFNWLASDSETAQRTRLGPLLAQAIGRLALSKQELIQLDDNYAAAVASGQFADQFDSDKPTAPYLPPDLFDSNGAWVCFGRADATTASQHLAESGTNRFTNSVFLVFLKMPGGRDQGLEWLDQMAACEEPVVLDHESRSPRPNPNVPQLPAKTELAIVRRALLVDSQRNIVASPLTESVQLRVMLADSSALESDDLQFVANVLSSRQRAFERQAYLELQLRRAALFANQAGGLKDVSAERDFKTGFGSHPWDEFEAPLRSDLPFPERAQPLESTRISCLGCHYPPGVYGLKSLERMRTEDENNDSARVLYPLMVLSVQDAEAGIIRWKQRQAGWKALKELWHS